MDIKSPIQPCGAWLIAQLSRALGRWSF